MNKTKDIRYVEMYKVRVKDILSSKCPFRFYPYVDEDKEDIHIYAMSVCLDLDTPIVKKLISSIEKMYASASKKERKVDFTEWDFDKEGHIILNERAKSIGSGQLVFETNDFPKNTLFLNGVDLFQYYSAKDLDANLGEIVKALLDANVIYKKRIKVDVTNA